MITCSSYIFSLKNEASQFMQFILLSFIYLCWIGSDLSLQIKLGVPGWKERYYTEKFPAKTPEEMEEVRKDIVSYLNLSRISINEGQAFRWLGLNNSSSLIRLYVHL